MTDPTWQEPQRITWEEPPPRTISRTSAVDAKTQALVDALKNAPGQWALVGIGLSSGTSWKLRRLGCKVVTRNTRRTPEGSDVATAKVCDVWACWPKEGQE